MTDPAEQTSATTFVVNIAVVDLSSDERAAIQSDILDAVTARVQRPHELAADNPWDIDVNCKFDKFERYTL